MKKPLKYVLAALAMTVTSSYALAESLNRDLLNEMQNSYWCNDEGVFSFSFKNNNSVIYHELGKEKDAVTYIDKTATDNDTLGEDRAYFVSGDVLLTFGIKEHILLLHISSKETAKFYKCNMNSDSGFVEPITEQPIIIKMAGRGTWCSKEGTYTFGSNFFVWHPHGGGGFIYPYNYVGTKEDKVTIIYNKETDRLVFGLNGDILTQYTPIKDRPTIKLHVCKEGESEKLDHKGGKKG